MSDEDIRAFAGELKEVEDQSSVMGFDRFSHPISETKVQAKIYDCVLKSERYKDK